MRLTGSADRRLPVPAGDARLALRVANTCIVLLAVGATLAITVLGQEKAIADRRAFLARQELLGREGQRLPIPPPASPDAPPRELLIDALIRARAAEALPDGERREMLIDRAEQESIAVTRSRPIWAEAWIVRAFASTLKNPKAVDVTRGAVERSYQDAPFLRVGGIWRVQWGVDHWAALTPSLRGDIVEEAVLLGRMTGEMRAAIFQIARGTPAYPALVERWHQLRARDIADSR